MKIGAVDTEISLLIVKKEEEIRVPFFHNKLISR